MNKESVFSLLEKSPNLYHTFFIKDDRLVYSHKDADFVLWGHWDHNPAANSIVSSMSEIEGASIADVGTCTGWFSHLFESMGADVTAVDMFDRNERYMMHTVMRCNHSFILKNVYQLSEINKEYDYVWSQDVFCHLENPLLAMRNIRSVCRKKVFIATDKVIPDINDITVQARWPTFDFNSICHYHNDAYTFSYSDQFMKTMFVNCGFKNPRVKFSYRALAGDKLGRFKNCEISDEKKQEFGRTVDVWEAEVDETKIAFPEHKKLDHTLDHRNYIGESLYV